MDIETAYSVLTVMRVREGALAELKDVLFDAFRNKPLRYQWSRLHATAQLARRYNQTEITQWLELRIAAVLPRLVPHSSEENQNPNEGEQRQNYSRRVRPI